MALESKKQNQYKLGMADAGVDLAVENLEAVAKPPLLFPTIFVCGMSVMVIQMCASRLISPVFGTSLLIWANLIGFTMIFMAIGYFLGGRIADRFPSPNILYRLTAIAALTMAIMPLISSPVLSVTGNVFKDVMGGLFWGSVAGIIVLFSASIILLGCVTPFAVRLRVNQIKTAGKTAGSIASINTLGSILGTFVPVLFIIPTIGTRATLYVFAAILLLFSLVGLYLTNKNQKNPLGG